jgi:EAL domain-containing protein (putative c-di-GMP-specific phosphodiesterase class I)/DNA-binding NarL/FixJ family response regulator
MSNGSDASEPRILVIDDSPAIHADYRKIFHAGAGRDAALSASEAALFSDSPAVAVHPDFEIDCALQGQEGLARVDAALAAERPYALAFIDMRMPPGWDGLETAARIWERDPNIQIVICTAYSDYSWSQIRAKLGASDRLLILKKPFDNIEVLQLADTLTQKWRLGQQSRHRSAHLEQMIRDHSRDLQTSNERVDQLHKQLVVAGLHEKAALNTQSRKRLALESNLQQALQNGELSVHYQPLVDVATRRIVSLEALVRWQHPQHGAISPAEFIPVAEQSGLILPLGEFVLQTVCEQVVRWEREKVPVVPVAVNISAVQLQQQNISEFVMGILRKTGMQPHLAVLELTESAIITNARSHTGELQSLRNLGVGIEIDDFGTGYSSLSYLRHLPIDTLKIDRSFISQIHINPADEAIVSAILAMAHCLGLKVTAEGVETATQLEVLRRLGCEVAQGFLFSRPLTAERCRDFLCEAAQRPYFMDTLRIQVAAGVRGGSRYLAARKL